MISDHRNLSVSRSPRLCRAYALVLTLLVVTLAYTVSARLIRHELQARLQAVHELKVAQEQALRASAENTLVELSNFGFDHANFELEDGVLAVLQSMPSQLGEITILFRDEKAFPNPLSLSTSSRRKLSTITRLQFNLPDEKHATPEPAEDRAAVSQFPKLVHPEVILSERDFDTVLKQLTDNASLPSLTLWGNGSIDPKIASEQTLQIVLGEDLTKIEIMRIVKSLERSEYQDIEISLAAEGIIGDELVDAIGALTPNASVHSVWICLKLPNGITRIMCSVLERAKPADDQTVPSQETEAEPLSNSNRTALNNQRVSIPSQSKAQQENNSQPSSKRVTSPEENQITETWHRYSWTRHDSK